MSAPLYILTDAEGFTTCCFAERKLLHVEVARRPLLAPITIHHWAHVNGNGPANGWKLLAVSEYSVCQ